VVKNALFMVTSSHFSEMHRPLEFTDVTYFLVKALSPTSVNQQFRNFLHYVYLSTIKNMLCRFLENTFKIYKEQKRALCYRVSAPL